ncbi:MAG: barstar family protein [Burkholderiales bacterium]
MSAKRTAGSKWGAERSGVYLAPADTSAIRAAATRGSLAWAELDSAAARSKDQFLAACARDLGFPDWFGGNWDALADCLQDRSWQPAPGLVVLWRGASRFAATAPDDFATALEIFRDAATYWKERGRLFIALLDGQPRDTVLPPFTVP